MADELPHTLKWKDELPTVPGMYWNRSKNRPKDLYIIRVSSEKVELYKWLTCPPNEEWAGPIPEPREEEMDA